MESNMTALELRDVFISDGYKQDLQELSSYLASIAQERPIVFLLAKHLRQRKYKFILEDERRDLFIDGQSIEFKFSYDCGMMKLEKELEALHDSIKSGTTFYPAKGGWGVYDGIFTDVYTKKPDFFVWIICSRDLSNVAPHDLEYINWTAEQLKYNQRYPYTNRRFLEIVDAFLQVLQVYRPFAVTSEEIVTAGDFPSTYHLRICAFSKAKQQELGFEHGQQEEAP
jgi:hypothetical protein